MEHSLKELPSGVSQLITPFWNFFIIANAGTPFLNEFCRLNIVRNAPCPLPQQIFFLSAIFLFFLIIL